LKEVQRPGVPKQIKPKNALTFRPNVASSSFDGVNQDKKCGAGMVLFLASYHCFSLKMGAGIGSNSRDKILELYTLLRLARDRGMKQLQVVGDSKVVVN
jgi:hypothetical protein